MAKTDWEIPSELQPEPAHYRFDLDRALQAIVGLKANVPPDAFTANTLGTERVGNGVVIRPDGLVLTIGYLITEAETIWLIAHDGRAVAGDALAYDAATGFGLVQPLGRLGLPHLEPVQKGRVNVGDNVLCAAAGGRRHAVKASIVGREDFAGYWEYLLDDALFTAPAHPFWSGAALIDDEGALLGIGSLILQRDEGQRRRIDMNMIVPAWLLHPIMNDLLTYGRVNQPARPWLGLNAVASGDALFIGGITDGGPADQAGIQPGDRIVAIGDQEVTDLADLWRSIWSCGTAGVPITLTLARKARSFTISVTSADRRARFNAPRLH
jgi:S1-C subfamily serine protease